MTIKENKQMADFNTVPNQRIVVTHKEKYKGNFLQIRKDYYMNAYKILKTYSAMHLYLYFAGNADGYKFGYSPQAILDEIYMPATTCRNCFNLLVEKGFLVKRAEKRNVYDFYETPYGKGINSD